MDNQLGWWVLKGEDLLAMLQRVQAGEDPDIVYAEEYANRHIEYPDNNEGWLT